MGVGEIAKELGLRWSSVSSDVRLKCEESARKDKERYLEASNKISVLILIYHT